MDISEQYIIYICPVFFRNLQESEEGLHVCLRTFWGVGRDHVEQYQKRTGNSIFLHIRRIRTKVKYSNNSVV